MSDYPKGGDIAVTRAWLDKEGFIGILNGWKADAILGLSEEKIMKKVPGERGEMLWGFLNTARQTTGGPAVGTAVHPFIDMKYRIMNAPKVADLRTSFESELQYKIAVKSADFVEAYPDVFETGTSQYGVAVDALLEHILVGNVGQSEMTTVTRNGDFLKIFDACCGYKVYRDQTDPSSIVRKRPDDTVTHKGAVVFKNEVKGDEFFENMARKELTDKLGLDAIQVFPNNGQSIFGMTSFPNTIHIFSIDYCLTSQAYTTTALRSFDMRQMLERVALVQSIFKIAQWISTVEEPQAPFHLVPSIRTRTSNGHHVTWERGMILKELKQTAVTRAAVDAMDAKLRRIAEVYTAKLANVEWGTVEMPNLLKVTRIGFKLDIALYNKMITKEKAIEHIRQGVTDLHALGFAHTDIKVANVFVSEGVAFLDDLEYVVAVNALARMEGRAYIGGSQTAVDQDLEELKLFVGDVMRL